MLVAGGAGAGVVALGVVLLGGVPGGDLGDLRPPASSLRDAGGATTPQPVHPGHRFVSTRSPAP